MFSGLDMPQGELEVGELQIGMGAPALPQNPISMDEGFALATGAVQKILYPRLQRIGNNILEIGKQDIRCGRVSMAQEICLRILNAQNIEMTLKDEIEKIHNMIHEQNILYLGFLNVRKKLSDEEQELFLFDSFLREFFRQNLAFNEGLARAEEFFSREAEERKLKRAQNDPVENTIEMYLERFRELPLDREIPEEGNFRVKNNDATLQTYMNKEKQLKEELPNPTHEEALRFITRIALERPDGTYGNYRAAFRRAYPEIWKSIKDVLPRGHEIENHKKHLELAGRFRRVEGRDMKLSVEEIESLLQNMPISSARCFAVLAETGCRIGELRSMRIRCHGARMDTITIKRKLEKVVDDIFHEIVIGRGSLDWNFWYALICELQKKDRPTAKVVRPLVQSERTISRHLTKAAQKVMKEHPEWDLSWVTPHAFRHNLTSLMREQGYTDEEIRAKWTG